MSGAAPGDDYDPAPDPVASGRSSPAAAIGDPRAFRRLVDDLRQQLARETGTPLGELRPHAAESLAVLNLAGVLIHPALLAATADPAAADLAPLILGPVTELIETASEGVPASILWGNVASVIESSARMIAGDHPARSDRALALAAGTLALSPLAGAWTGRVGGTFRRTSCCQVTGPDPAERRCPDCVRSGPPEATSDRAE